MSDTWVQYLTLLAAAAGALAPAIKALYKLRMRSTCMLGDSLRSSSDNISMRVRRLEEGDRERADKMMDSDAKADLP